MPHLVEGAPTIGKPGQLVRHVVRGAGRRSGSEFAGPGFGGNVISLTLWCLCVIMVPLCHRGETTGRFLLLAETTGGSRPLPDRNEEK